VSYGTDLSASLAEEVLGWHKGKGDLWWRKGSVTGLRIARKVTHVPILGYFRPDVNLFHVQLCVAVVEGRGGAMTYGFPSGGKFRVDMELDGIPATHCVTPDETLSGETTEAIAETTLALWRAADEAAKTR